MYKNINYFEIPHIIEPARAKPKPKPSNIKFLVPLISLYKTTPQRADIADGPLDTIGKVMV